MPTVRNRHFLILDLMLIPTLPFVALMLRVELGQVPLYLTSDFWLYILLATAIKPVVFYVFGLYSRYWRFASVEDLLSIMWSVSLTTILMLFLVWLEIELRFFSGTRVPLSLPLLDGMLTFLLIGGSRFSLRMLGEPGAAADPTQVRRALIIGGRRDGRAPRAADRPGRPRAVPGSSGSSTTTPPSATC